MKSTTRTEYTSIVSSARSDVDPKISIYTKVTNGIKVESDCCHGNMVAPATGELKNFLVLRRSLTSSPVPAPAPLCMKWKHWGVVPTNP